MEVQEAIEILKQFQKDTPKLPYDCLANKEIEAVGVVLNEYEKQQKEIKELEKHYKHEQEYINGEIFSAKQMHIIDEDYISKDKIKEIKEGIELNYFKANYTINEVIDILQELLEDK